MINDISKMILKEVENRIVTATYQNLNAAIHEVLMEVSLAIIPIMAANVLRGKEKEVTTYTPSPHHS